MSLKSVLVERLDSSRRTSGAVIITTDLLQRSSYTDEDLGGMLEVLLDRPTLLTPSEAMMTFISFAPNNREFDTPVMTLFFRFIMDKRVEQADVASVIKEAEKIRPIWFEHLVVIKRKAFAFAYCL